MKILHFQRVSDEKSAVQAIFAFQYAEVDFCGWKVIESRHTKEFWLAPPKILIFPGEGAAPVSVTTVRMPKEIMNELRSLVLAEYEKLRAGG